MDFAKVEVEVAMLARDGRARNGWSVRCRSLWRGEARRDVSESKELQLTTCRCRCCRWCYKADGVVVKSWN